jgi:hypothetical protein
LLFETEDELTVGSKIECVVQMGPASNEGPDVSLHVHGVTVRTQRGLVAVSIKKYRLRPKETSPAKSA